MSLEPSEMGEAEFVETFGHVFEDAPWIARQTWFRGLDNRHDSPAGLHEAMCNEIRRADRDLKLELLRSHPELGLGVTGALPAAATATGKTLTESSRREQSRSGLDACSPEEFEEFQCLNAAYRDKFGFPFILAIKGYHRKQILEIFRQRLAHDPDEEFQAALGQVMKIGLFRIQEVFE